MFSFSYNLKFSSKKFFMKNLLMGETHSFQRVGKGGGIIKKVNPLPRGEIIEKAGGLLFYNSPPIGRGFTFSIIPPR